MKKKIIINGAILYIFDEHRLCPLRVRGKESVLNVPASRCLQLLLEHPGVVISQSEFFNQVWQKNGQYVTANTLYQNISLLRKGMREAGLTKNVIRTIPKVGVMFSGTVEILEEDGDEAVEQKVATPEPPRSENKPVEVPVEKPQLTSNWQKKGVLRISLITAFTIAMLILLISHRSQSAQFFNTHNRVTSVNQCSVYIDRDDLEANVEGYVKSLEVNNVVCNPDEFVYITKTPSSKGTLVLFCDVNAQGDLRCSTRFKIDNQHAPMAGLRPAR